MVKRVLKSTLDNTGKRITQVFYHTGFTVFAFKFVYTRIAALARDLKVYFSILTVAQCESLSYLTFFSNDSFVENGSHDSLSPSPLLGHNASTDYNRTLQSSP